MNFFFFLGFAEMAIFWLCIPWGNKFRVGHRHNVSPPGSAAAAVKCLAHMFSAASITAWQHLLTILKQC